ncbi:MAG: tRNA (adenosine(37)-N6)-dimethylallyltransferase MiaA [Bacteroidetes bacterium]|jgi:tRNA dimethylallyltransferase|nr:tRNA (adenosine(37)-N6)-dimethylallyltransferase MiaA [Bacteroidota bacterium]MBP7255937.1 tRNA (adenosine(37)-N6)-dimethylallyltransferase MiaA [Chitinophagales bacterium]MBK8673417.1 tRNA (adenosine(37)-N6)-dimethylallyltransferase MiaA [Bacteroidota bacterium]MBK9633604.1 tRNA (adenosine(37)-N6)-dimethylallyltransferase MiaA [Bacteroidota bacterium]MBL0080877.1 tRNA (adenosine(37)-N6)-dimethylallyltransferase MiaA [Bacteroidota bacterium]
MKENRKKVILVLGPTASGKTALGISIAKKYSTEIVSADSRQIYKELNIGVARPTIEELNSIPHHLIGHVSIHDYYNAGHFEKDALAAISVIFKNKDIAIMVGGTGLYMKSVCQGFDEIPAIDLDYRQKLNEKVEQEGIQFLLDLLAEKDPIIYNKIDKSNKHRVIRAAEVLLFTGNPISFYQNGIKKERDFDIIKIGLNPEMAILEKNIANRTNQMFDDGLLMETEKLFKHKSLNALQTVGYREIFDYYEGLSTLDEAKENIKKNTRKYAKRQLTWFKKEENIHWFNPNDRDSIFQFLENTVV